MQPLIIRRVDGILQRTGESTEQSDIDELDPLIMLTGWA